MAGPRRRREFRPSTSFSHRRHKKGVDRRDKPGDDERETRQNQNPRDGIERRQLRSPERVYCCGLCSMPSSNRLYRLAVGGCLAAALALGTIPALGQIQNSGNENTKNPPNAEQTNSSTFFTTPPPIHVTVTLPQKEDQTPRTYEELCQAPKTNDDADVCQQWRMANAAEKQIYWLKKQYDLTKLEIGLLIGSILVTLAASCAALIAAYAAQKSAKVIPVLERALVYVSGFHQEIGTTIVNGIKTLDHIRVYFHFKNTGATPTRHLVHYSNWKAFRGDIPEEFDFPDIGDQEKVPVVIGPGVEILSAPLIIPKDIIQSVMDGIDAIYLWGWIDYNDVFPDSPRRRTEFCSKLLLPGLSDAGFPIVQTLHYKRHNGSDDECLKPPSPYVKPTQP